MYRYTPQKHRSKIRVKLGTLFYCLLRHFTWIRWKKHFATIDKNFSQDDFPFTVFEHSVPLKRNLSEVDIKLQEGKIANLEIAVKKISGVVLESGKVFSYWRLIGNPTKKKGYKNGMMLVNGRPTSSIGGGLCALSNLIYWITLHSPLTVIERYRHSFDVFPDSNRTQPFGSGATCVYNYRDLMIKNNTNQSYALLVWIDKHKGRLYGKLISKTPVNDKYEIYQKDHLITCEIGGIYVRHNSIWRKHFLVKNNDYILQNEEFVTENHAIMMYEPLLENHSGNNL